MEKLTKHLLELFGQKRYSEVEGISKEKMLKVDSNEVTKIIKKNHSLLNCTCESSGKTGHNSICRHKQFFIIFPFLKLFNEKLDKLINDYESYLSIKVPLKTELMLNDLKKLKKIVGGKSV